MPYRAPPQEPRPAAKPRIELYWPIEWPLALSAFFFYFVPSGYLLWTGNWWQKAIGFVILPFALLFMYVFGFPWFERRYR